LKRNPERAACCIHLCAWKKT